MSKKNCIIAYIINFMEKNKRVVYNKNLKLNKLTGIYGSINSENCKAFYINISGWINLDKTIDKIDKPKFFKKFSDHVRYSIRAISSDIHPKFLYSFVDMDISDVLIRRSSTYTGFCAIEVTIMLKEPITDFPSNINLKNNIKAFAELIEDKLINYSPYINMTKRRVKKTILA